MIQLMIFGIVILCAVAFVLVGGVYLFFKKTAFGASMKTSLPARDSVLIRYMLVVFITLCLMIPLLFVGELVDERQGLQRQVVHGIASSWGQSQTFIGPILVVPVTQQRTVVKDIEQQDGTRTQQRIQETSHHMLTILPDMLRHSMQIKPEERRRSIYRYTVYSSQVDIETTFTLPDVARELPKGAQLHLDQAYLSFGISDPTGLKGIQAAMEADFLPKAVTLSAEPGTRVRQFNTGFSMPLDRELGALQSDRQKFSVRLSLNVDGSGGVRVAPVGEQSLISMQSSWPHPNFTGVKLPLEREISAQGFTARWDIPHLARSYPQRFLETAQKTEERSSRQNESAISGFTVGVDLFEPVTYYTLIDRAIKYAVLFIAMTFVALLAFEAIIKKRLHPV